MLFDRAVAAAALAAFLAASATAQQRLVALVADNASVIPSEVVLTGPTDCTVAHRCAPALFPAPVDPIAGGTAHDPRTGGTWISNGRVLAKVDPDSCAYQCAPIVLPLPAGVFVTGLACHESQDLLLLTDSAGGLTTVEEHQCQFGPWNRCQISVPLPPQHAYAGLAVDELTGTVFYSASNFGGTSLSQAIYMAPISHPCNPTCNGRMHDCPAGTAGFGGITGLAFDPCSRQLIATDGLRVVKATFVQGPLGCSLIDHTCCNAATPGLRGAIGLCVRPAGGEDHGFSCANGSCGPCGQLGLRMIGEPSIGNAEFGFRLVDATVGARAWLGIGFGPCALPGLHVPPFCGNLTLPLFPIPPVFIGPQPTLSIGGIGCTGTTEWGISVPLDGALCGDVFSAQAILLCTNSDPFGTAMTRCTRFVIGGT